MLKEDFKSGQDFEYVKYRIAQKLNVNQTDIDLYHNDKKLIPMFSICDVELNEDKKIYFDISNDSRGEKKDNEDVKESKDKNENLNKSVCSEASN